MRIAALLLALFPWTQNPDSTPDRETGHGTGPVRVDWTLEPAEVAPAEAFTLTVTRRWNRGLVAGPWDETPLAALHVTLLDQHREDDGDWTVESRRYQGRAFTLEPVVLPPLVFQARTADGTQEHRAETPALTIPVRASLNPEDPGAAERPGELLPEPPLDSPRPDWLVALAAALVLMIGLLWWRPWRRGDASRGPEADPSARARARLAALRDRLPEATRVHSFYVEAATLVRDYLHEAQDLPTHRSTTEQILHATNTQECLSPARHAALASSLHRCDRVKFARHLPPRPDHERLVQELTRFLDVAEDLAS